MLSRLKPRDWRMNEALESGGLFGDANDYLDDDLGTPLIEPGNTLSMSCKPWLGLIGAGKYLPCKMAPLTLEIHFAPATDALWQDAFQHPAGRAATPLAFTNSFSLDDVHVKCDVVSLDSALDASLTNILAQNKALTWSYQTWYTQTGLITGNVQETSITLSRAVTRLKSLFLTFQQEPNPTSTVLEMVHPSIMLAQTNRWSMYDPTFSLQCQLGTKLFPELPCKTTANFWEHLRKAVDVHDTSTKSLSIRPHQYLRDQFIAAFSMEKVPGAGFSGLNTRSGDTIRLELKGLNPGYADRFFCPYGLRQHCGDPRERCLAL